MESRVLGRTWREVSVIGQGCWQLGADWGDVEEKDALGVLRAAAAGGVTFFDTADVYGDGRSEQLVGRFVREVAGEGAGADEGDRAGEGDQPGSGSSVMVATKMGRRADPHEASAYTAANFAAWNDRSRRNLGTERLDLVQLHCPPSEVYRDDAVFDALDDMVAQGRMAAYGVSVETVDEALAAIARPNVASVQIIINVFRRKPLEEVLPAAAEAGVGIIARVPLASGLLSGKYTESTTFAASDHRNYNRRGEAFDVGETFAGVPFDVGLAAAREFSGIVGELKSSYSDFESATPAQVALRWIVDQHGVSTVIPGARSAQQAQANAATGELPRLPAGVDEELASLYAKHVKSHVHDRW